MTETDPAFAWPAPAKVNLFLHVGPVKPNRRHDLDSLVAFTGTGASDYVSALPSDTLSLEVTGPSAGEAGPVEDNLVLRAAKALQAEAGVTAGAHLKLWKWLPVAAGIGGGSSDAAAALRALTKLWSIDPKLAGAVAPGLGGDVPVALMGKAARMQGEGERVRPAPLPGMYSVLLVNPRVACPTGPVFRAYDAAGGGAGFDGDAPWPEGPDRAGFAAWLSAQRNDLEAPAIGLVPEIGAVLDWLRGQRDVLLARMSGSGATCFALFNDLASAERVSILLKMERPHWWAAASRLEPLT